MWPIGRPTLQRRRATGGRGFEFGPIHMFLHITKQTNDGVPRGSPGLGHVAPLPTNENMPRVGL
jgi:hypothetical protein